MKCPVCGTVFFDNVDDAQDWWMGMSGDWRNTELMDKLSPGYMPEDSDDDGEK